MRYVIIGAGGIGGTIGGRLAQAGREVVLVARGEHLAALRATGLRLVDPDGARLLGIPAVGGPEEVALTPGDVLVRLHGVATPVNHALQELANGLARQGAPPRSVAPECIERRISSASPSAPSAPRRA